MKKDISFKIFKVLAYGVIYTLQIVLIVVPILFIIKIAQWLIK